MPKPLCLIVALLLLPAVFAAEVFISPKGDDAWDGSQSEHGAGNAGPVASFQRAKAVVRELKAKTPGPMVVTALPGEYFLTETLVFEPQDSGTQAAPISYKALGTVLVSGGRRLQNFKAAENGTWQLEIPEVKSGAWTFSELFVHGQRRFRPHLPREGYYYIQGELPASDKPGKGFDRFTYPEGSLNKDWHNLNDVEITPFQNWTMSRMRVTEIDDAQRAVTLSLKTPSPMEWNKLARGRRFLVHNVFEALQPGEWYLDTKSGLLTYSPLPGEEISKTNFIAPVLERLIEIKGGFTPETNVSYLRFNDLRLRHCAVKFGTQGYSSPQAEINVRGAVIATGARNCVFERCEFSQLGGYALELAAGCKDCLALDCDFLDLGAGGVKLGDTRYRDAAKLLEEIAERNAVRDCYIAHGGRHFPAAIGIWIGQSPNNSIEHNEIFDFYYTGISVGWTWGYGPSNAHHNTFAYNHVHRIGQGVLTDLGAIYTLGNSPGTTIHHNQFHDMESHDYGGWGIYYDEGSTGIVSENNLVYNCKSATFHQHYGKENVVRNNILAFGSQYQLMRTRPENHLTVTIEGNLIYFGEADLLGSNWTGGKFAINRNMYWSTGPKPITFAKMPLDQWREKGYDRDSIIEDPLFVDAEHFKFELQDRSPVKKIGFQPIDLTGVGPKRARERVMNWPRAFPPDPNSKPRK